MALALGDAYELDPTLFELRRHGEVVPTEPQVFDVLSYLVHHRDRVVPKEELMDAIWGGRFVSETAVTSRIKQARRALGDDGQSQTMVRTVHGRGYRFVGEVRELGTTGGPAPDAPAARSPVQYTVSDGLHIAYQTSGGGPRDVVLISGFISHLELDWADPRHVRFLDRLGQLGRLIRFDKRGTGMSDRPQGLPDLETRMHDVLAVMDAVGSQRAVLVGYSEGGPMATLCAATHPERVEALVLYGAYAKRVWAEDYPWGQKADERVAYTDKLVTSWDWEADLRRRCPSGDDAMARWWGMRARAAATPTTVRALMDMNSLVDVRDALPAVKVPTVVMHRTGDTMTSLDEGRYQARHIPGATMVELPGQDHLVTGDPDQIVDAIAEYLAGLPAPRPAPDLALAALAAVDGPDAGRVADELVGAGGRRRAGPGGMALVLFDGPATAVRAATRATAALGVGDVGVGLHVAEVARESASLDGFGPAVAAALAEHAREHARPGEPQVWASATVRDLLSGSGIDVVPTGTHQIGPAGRQPVFRADLGVLVRT
jgi:pimeloyl-ACP methyl ester carboxylesterase